MWKGIGSGIYKEHSKKKKALKRKQANQVINGPQIWTDISLKIN